MTRECNSRVLRTIPLVLIVGLLCSSAYGKIIYVDDDSMGANDGTSWENAYNFLQDALADANSSAKPVEISVAQGIYTPDSDSAMPEGTGDREATFRLINGFTLRGGYAGITEPVPDARDVAAYETILSGDLNGDDVEVANPIDLREEPTRAENSYHVVTGSSTDETAVLDGFTITGGNADGLNQQYAGGGMYISSGSPTLTDCTFSGNSALHGGGMHNWENSNPTLTNCTFLGNRAKYGGAIENNFASSPMLTNCSFTENSAESGGGMDNGSSSNPKLVDCMFSRNRAERGGGGMDNRWLSSPMLTNCIFSGNSAMYGGGMLNWDFADPTLIDCTFSRNSGIGLYNKNSSLVLKNCIFSENSGGMYNEDSNLTLTNCAFSGNSSGGISNLDSSLTLNNCTFTENSAGNGGGISSASEGFGETELTLTNCTFTSNLAVGKIARGGGMYCSTRSRGKTELTMTNCMFTGNQALGEHGRGGGIYSSIENPFLTNCIFIANSAVASGGAIYNDEGWPEVNNSRFTGNSAGSEGGGMYNVGWEFSVASPTLSNCTFNGNLSSYGGAIYNQYGTSSNLINCILWGNIADYGSQVCLAGTTASLVVEYSNLQGGRTAIKTPFTKDEIIWGPGNIDVDPDFVQAGYWTQPTPRQPGEPAWIEGEYHLKSQAGRWDPISESWVIDEVTSPCIDTGDPNSPVAFEPFPNGARVNMGAYGSTPEASKSPSGLHAQYGGGTGEPDDPYLLYTAEHLNTLGAEPNNYDKHFKLMADIDLSGYSYDRALIAPDMNDAEPGFQGTAFNGVFNGNGHVITHLRIQGYESLGLFGQTGPEAKISNLGLEAVDINGTGSWVGGLVGVNGGSITMSYSSGPVNGDRYVGGLVGWNWSGSNITNCYSTGTVNGDGYVGGLVGSNDPNSYITTSYSTGTVNGTGDCVGGLVGANGGSITLSYSTGEVTGDRGVGGLVGGNGYGNMTNCYSSGPVNGNDYVGGLVGSNNPNSYITTSYSTGPVNGTGNSVGGLVGWNGGIITSSFWDIETSGLLTSNGGIGKTTTEMQTASTFLDAGWDFVDEADNGTEDIWWIDEGNDYPRLWWELIPEK